MPDINPILNSLFYHPDFKEVFKRANVMYAVNFVHMQVVVKSNNKEAPLTDEEKAKLQEWYDRNVHVGSIKFE